MVVYPVRRAQGRLERGCVCVYVLVQMYYALVGGSVNDGRRDEVGRHAGR